MLVSFFEFFLKCKAVCPSKNVVMARRQNMAEKYREKSLRWIGFQGGKGSYEIK